MTKKERNDAIYRKLMEHRKRDPKHYGLTLLGADYEDIRNYAVSAKCVREELAAMVSRFNVRIREVVAMYGITKEELRSYFTFHNYSLSF